MTPPEPVWMELEASLALHARSIALHGGAEGLRDLGLLDSALQRPRNRYLYDGVRDLAELAATYAVAISANHPFNDGNKRAAFQALALFLRLNGARLTAGQPEAVRTIVALASGEMSLEALTLWVRDNMAAV